MAIAIIIVSGICISVLIIVMGVLKYNETENKIPNRIIKLNNRIDKIEKLTIALVEDNRKTQKARKNNG